MPEYKAIDDPNDSEALAIATFDSTGKLVRGYQQNARFRSIESRLTSSEQTARSSIPSKVNEITRRMNALDLFSSDLTLSLRRRRQAPRIYTTMASFLLLTWSTVMKIPFITLLITAQILGFRLISDHPLRSTRLR
jgi:hypothetical protein